jgi:hypothetical protein
MNRNLCSFNSPLASREPYPATNEERRGRDRYFPSRPSWGDSTDRSKPNLAGRPRHTDQHLLHIGGACFAALVVLGCSGSPAARASGPGAGSTLAPPAPPSSTSLSSVPVSTSPYCQLVPTAQVTRLLNAGALTAVPTGGGCEWFASDTSVDVAYSVDFYPTAGDASTTFQGDQLFDPGQRPFAYGDRAFYSSIPGAPRHARAVVLIGTAIVIADVNGPAGQATPVAAAQGVVETAGARVRQGWRP